MTASLRAKRGPVRPVEAAPVSRRLRQVNFRIPVEVWERLDALASVRNHSQSTVVADALTHLYETLTPAERRLVDQILEHRKKPTG